MQRGAIRPSLHLIVFALVVAAPLLLLVGVLLYRSVTLEREQIDQRLGQVLEALVADLDRDTERRVAVLETLSTSPLAAGGELAGLLRPGQGGPG